MTKADTWSQALSLNAKLVGFVRECTGFRGLEVGMFGDSSSSYSYARIHIGTNWISSLHLQTAD